MSAIFHRFFARNRWIILVILLITPLGFGTKLYEGPGSEWVNHSLGGVLYVIFWCLVCSIIWPAVRAGKIACMVFLVTCFLEVAQLWHPVFLEKIRDTFLGAALLGNSFTWLDFPHYAAGGIIGFLLISWLRPTKLAPTG